MPQFCPKLVCNDPCLAYFVQLGLVCLCYILLCCASSCSFLLPLSFPKQWCSLTMGWEAWPPTPQYLAQTIVKVEFGPKILETKRAQNIF